MQARPMAHEAGLRDLTKEVVVMTKVGHLAIVALLAVVSTSAAAQPVRWNGHPDGQTHWYEYVRLGGYQNWYSCRAAAQAMSWLGFGGDLATSTSPEENELIAGLLGTADTAWLGSYQDPDSGPDQNWHWITGEPWQYTNWRLGEPNDAEAGQEDRLAMFPDGTWNDAKGDGWNGRDYGFVVEYVTPANLPVAWTVCATNGPSARAQHAIAYDSYRNVVVLFGGDDGDQRGDTWEWDGNLWRKVSDSGPCPRNSHGMVYDSRRHVVVLFGGTAGGGYLNDTWEWDGATWTQKAAGGPSPRYGFAMAYDSVRGVTVLFGGNTGPGTYSNETWEWDGNAWTLTSTSGPSPRDNHAMAFDQKNGLTVLFGGRDTSGLVGDTWTWDGATWAQRRDSGPLPREAHSVAYDSRMQVIVLFGGGEGSQGTDPLGDTWEWDGDEWTQRLNYGCSARWSAAMVYDAAREAPMLFGGCTINERYGETWEYRLVTVTLGDVNCDGYFDGFDIDPFFFGLGDALEYQKEHQGCYVNNADINGDGWVDGFDIDPFFELLGG
jgi:hypothetical protein